MKTKILENLTKRGGVKTSFLKENNTNEKECYDIVNGSKNCYFCDYEASFISFNNFSVSIFNLVPSCQTCNQRKSTKNTRYF